MAIATTMNGEERMSYDVKALLISLARYAAEIDAKKMYKHLAAITNAEGVALPSWEEARQEALEDEEKKPN